MCYMTYFNTASHVMAMTVDTKLNSLGLENFDMLHLASSLLFMLINLMCFMTFFNNALHCTAMSVATKINILGLEKFTGCALHIPCLFMLIVLMYNMTYFNTASLFMDMSLATKINFLWYMVGEPLLVVYCTCLHFSCWSVIYGTALI